MKLLLCIFGLLFYNMVFAQATQFAVIYSTDTGRVRSIVVFNGVKETNANLATIKKGTGETLVLFNMVQFGPLEVIQNLVNQVTGKVPVDDRYVYMKNGKVTDVVIADSKIDIFPKDVVVIKHIEATIGWDVVNNVPIKPIIPVFTNEISPALSEEVKR